MSTRSPCAICSRSAVCGLISTQLLHIAEVSGSGISCSHGRCAVDPSPNCCDTYGRKWKGNCDGSPEKTGSLYRIADCGLRSAECGFAAATAVDLATSSALFQGSAIGDFSFPAISISTS